MEEKKIIYLQKVDGVFSADKEKPFEKPFVSDDLEPLIRQLAFLMTFFIFRGRR